MPSPIDGPCSPFATELDMCCLVSGGFDDPCLIDNQPVSQTVLDNSLLVASEILWAATGRQYGLCEVTVRPCYTKDCDACNIVVSTGFPWIPILENGEWTNISCLQNGCVCENLCSVALPYPVNEVTTVTVNGVEVLAESYRVDQFRNLVRTDGECWPRCQDDWSVTLTYGRAPTPLIVMATAALACELAKSCTPGTSCQLPKRMQSMTRQGVTVGFIDPMEFLGQGMTGIYLVDLAIRKANPKGLLKQASVYSPELANKWKREGT